jgi:hypothetical protein
MHQDHPHERWEFAQQARLGEGDLRGRAGETLKAMRPADHQQDLRGPVTAESGHVDMDRSAIGALRPRMPMGLDASAGGARSLQKAGSCGIVRFEKRGIGYLHSSK